jgi:hypothetical protein
MDESLQSGGLYLFCFRSLRFLPVYVNWGQVISLGLMGDPEQVISIKLFYNSDICRVCRCEGTHDRPLFHPCICTGSIKFIHQECLVQWLRYSRKEYCELCNYRFSFTPSKFLCHRFPIEEFIYHFLSCSLQPWHAETFTSQRHNIRVDIKSSESH